MTEFTASMGFPNPPNNPSSDVPVMQENNDSFISIWDEDHFGFNDSNGGQHQFIRMPLVGTVPGSTTGATELALSNSTSAIGGANNLFFYSYNKTIASQGVQMTRNENPTIIQNGFSWIPGGGLIQWGAVSSPGSAGTVSFNTNFSIACYGVFLTPRNDGSHSNPYTYGLNGAPSPTSFSYTGTSSGSETLYWWAIGI